MNKMAKKKIYKSVVTIELLSEEPIGDGYSLNDIVYQMTDGDWSGDMEWDVRNITLKGKKAVKACEKQGTSPDFFMMDEDGNEVEL